MAKAFAVKKRSDKPGPREHFRLDRLTGKPVRYNRKDDLPSNEIQFQRPTSSVSSCDYTPKVVEYADEVSSSDSDENTKPTEPEPRKEYARLLVKPKVSALLPPGEVLRPEGSKLCPSTQGDRFDFFDAAESNGIIANATFETDIHLCDKILFPSESFVEVEMPNSYDYVKHTQYVAVVKTDGQWKKMPGETRGGVIKFACVAMEGLFVMREPLATHVNLSFDGYTYKDDDDNRIIGEFPEDSIETPTPITIMVIPSKTDNQDNDIPQISPCFHVMDNPSLALKKPARLQLPLKETEEEDPGEYSTCLLRWKGINVEVVRRNMMTDNGVVTTEVDTFSGYSVADIRQGYLLSATSTALSIKVLLKAGMLNVCKILTFIDRYDKNSFWFECVLKDKASDVVLQNERRGLLHLSKCESRDLYLFDGHKVRVYAEGNIQLAKGYPRNKNILVFLSTAEDNHITYPVQKKMLPGSIYAVLNFESVSRHWQKTLHTCHYLYESSTVLPVVGFYPKTIAMDPVARPKEKVAASPRVTKSITARIKTPLMDKTPGVDRLITTKDTAVKETQRVTSENSDVYATALPSVRTPEISTITRSFTTLSAARTPDYDGLVTTKDTAVKETQRINSENSNVSARSLPSICTPEITTITRSSTTLSTARTPDYDGLFSDRSLMALARVLPPRLTTQLGIELGLKNCDIDRMKVEDKPPEEIMFGVLKKTIINNIRLSQKEKLEKLCSALEELDLNNFADVLQEKFRQDQCLRKRDFVV